MFKFLLAFHLPLSVFNRKFQKMGNAENAETEEKWQYYLIIIICKGIRIHPNWPQLRMNFKGRRDRYKLFLFPKVQLKINIFSCQSLIDIFVFLAYFGNMTQNILIFVIICLFCGEKYFPFRCLWYNLTVFNI